MPDSTQKCFNCGKSTSNAKYGFAICLECLNKQGLMTNETIQKHNKNNPNFKKEAESKLEILEQDYARKKIKLLHILESLGSN